jgi:hypothetical protein
MKQMGAGVCFYAADYNDYLPYGNTSGGESFRQILIDGTSSDHYGKGYIPLQILSCPTDMTRTATVDFWAYYGDDSNLSYGFNEALVCNKTGPRGSLPYRITSHAKASDDVLFFHVNCFDGCNSHLSCFPLSGSYLDYVGEPNHPLGHNYVFLDMHVGFYSVNDYMNDLRYKCDISAIQIGDMYLSITNRKRQDILRNY